MTVPNQTQTINISAGAVEYTWPLTITELTGKNISADVIALSLGSDTAPGAWLTPSVDTAQSVLSQRVVQLLVGTTLTPTPGTYRLWSKVTDSPETVPRRNAYLIIT